MSQNIRKGICFAFLRFLREIYFNNKSFHFCICFLILIRKLKNDLKCQKLGWTIEQGKDDDENYRTKCLLKKTNPGKKTPESSNKLFLFTFNYLKVLFSKVMLIMCNPSVGGEKGKADPTINKILKALDEKVFGQANFTTVYIRQERNNIH